MATLRVHSDMGVPAVPTVSSGVPGIDDDDDDEFAEVRASHALLRPG